MSPVPGRVPIKSQPGSRFIGTLCEQSARVATTTCRSLSVGSRSRPRQRRRSLWLLMTLISLSYSGRRSKSVCTVCMRPPMLEARRRH